MSSTVTPDARMSRRADAIARREDLKNTVKLRSLTPEEYRELTTLGDLVAEIEEYEGRAANLPAGGVIPGLDDTPGSDGKFVASRAKFTERDDGAETYEVPTGDKFGLTRSESVSDFVAKEGNANEYRDLTLGGMMKSAVVGGGNELERRALSEGTDSAGGYTVPTVLSGQMIDNLRAKSVVFRAGATTVPLSSDTNDFAKLLTDPTAAWRAESASISDNSPTFGRVRFTPQSCTSLVLASRELVEDSKNLDEALGRAFAGAFAAEMDRIALYGSGSSNEPTGVKNTSGIGQVSMGTNGAALAGYDPFVDAWLEVEQDNAPGITAYVMAPRTQAALAKLKDGNGQPLKRPELLQGLPFINTTNVPIDETQGTATDASTILAGHWPHLVVGMRNNLRIEVLKERYSDNFQYGFLAHLRADVQVWHPESFAEIIGVTP